MQKYITFIEELWQKKDHLDQDDTHYAEAVDVINSVISQLEDGKIVVCQKHDDQWIVNEWIKKAILLYFKISHTQFYDGGYTTWHDKISPQFTQNNGSKLATSNTRIVPGAIVRSGSYIGINTVIMPSFINIGAHVGDRTLIDTWATVGSCAYIGKNCHISGGTGIGGVLEPLQNQPVIIEDNCFIGARSEIAEGVIVEEGAVISMGVFIGKSTKIIDRHTGKIIYGKVPAYSVVVPGSIPNANSNLPSLYCAVIIKKVDKNTRNKTSINELLRE